MQRCCLCMAVVWLNNCVVCVENCMRSTCCSIVLLNMHMVGSNTSVLCVRSSQRGVQTYLKMQSVPQEV